MLESDDYFGEIMSCVASNDKVRFFEAATEALGIEVEHEAKP